MISLIFFSFFPILVLQVWNLATLPSEIEDDYIDTSKKELILATDLIKQSLQSDINQLTLLSKSPHIVNFLSNTSNIEYTTQLETVLASFTERSLMNFSDSSRILEIGIDIIDLISTTDDVSGDILNRELTYSYSNIIDEYTLQRSELIYEIANYYPYLQLKTHFPTKTQFLSSIRQMTNFLTGEAILDTKGDAIPVNIHVQYIFNETDSIIGLIYSVNTAYHILDVIDDLSEPNRPAIITNKAGSVFYSDNTLTFTEVTGYYKTILNVGFDTTEVDRNGYQNEITVYRQIALDLDQSQTLLLAKVLPRSHIYKVFEAAIVQAVGTLIISVILASTLAFITTQWLTKRMRKISIAAEKISEGDFSVKLDLNGTDELAKLNRSFHRMTESLKAKKDD